MAEIKNFLKEREKRDLEKLDYSERIRRHKLSSVYRILMLLAILVVLCIISYVQYIRHLYTDYDVVYSVKREKANNAIDYRLQNAILTYSKDGVHCTNTKGVVAWNQTYEISDIKLAVNGNVVALGEYNGRRIYVQDTDRQLGEISTTLPIKNIAVAANGNVTAVLEDTDVTWINTYNPNGEILYTGQTHMSESGYPSAISLSPNGELLAVSYLYIEAGNVKSNIAFFNFGPVGANQSDYLVSTYAYEDLLIPEVHFMSNDTAFAVGDGRLMIFKGGQVPVSESERMISEEIQSVFYNDKYIGLVFLNDTAQGFYRLEIYNASGNLVTKYYFDLDYRDILFEQKDFVIYNEKECQISTYDGTDKFKGDLKSNVNLILPAGGRFRYQLVTDQTLETIQLR